MIRPAAFAPWVSAQAVELARAQAASAPAPSGDVAALRAHYDAYNRRHLDVALAAYPVDFSEAVIAGVRVAIVVPRDVPVGPATLICLHGGAFMWGRGAGALLEAVPVAVVASSRVIAVEYSLAPERVFPAAVEDVLAVHRVLLDEMPAESIGLYGCSAGGILTAQAVARMIADGTALPGAIAMLHGTGLEIAGDSAASAAAFAGTDPSAAALSLSGLPYFSGTSADDPLAFPGEHLSTLARFPPSLLVTGTRDFAAGAVTVMHRRLLAAGAEAALLHFDGMWHAHHMATTLPESRETFAAMARFFANHLA